jgi:hypothetical protein
MLGKIVGGLETCLGFILWDVIENLELFISSEFP